jgi:uncharacterized membrane protein
MDDLGAALLWIHVLSGAVWIGACACVAIAGSALAAGSDEFRDFVTRALPRLNRFNAAAAMMLVATGTARFIVLAMVDGFAPSTTFIQVLAMKVGLFAAMALGLASAWRAEAALRGASANVAESVAAPMRRLIAVSGLTALLGAAAMVLGLWLVGS